MRAAMRRTSATRVEECWEYDQAAQYGDECEYMYKSGESALLGTGTGFEGFAIPMVAHCPYTVQAVVFGRHRSGPLTI
jgi:hypothetical protein